MIETVVVRDPHAVVLVNGLQIKVTAAQAGIQGPPGPQGPPGANGLGTISADSGNAIRQGTDGGLYCPAVISGISHW